MITFRWMRFMALGLPPWSLKLGHLGISWHILAHLDTEVLADQGIAIVNPHVECAKFDAVDYV